MLFRSNALAGGSGVAGGSISELKVREVGQNEGAGSMTSIRHDFGGRGPFVENLK